VRIPPEKIDEIRNATDIVDLVGAFVKLKKRGKNFIGLCPFHTEKTPSFNISSDRQMYHCFGCGVGGNVFTFVMEYEKISFTEAVHSLAEKAGIVLPAYTEASDVEASEQEELYNICKIAGLFFYSCLTETTEGKFALEYFANRGFTNDTIRIFGLGYAPNSWGAFLKHAEEKKIPCAFLEKAGLIRKREDGSYYDYFRGRAIFPIFSVSGRVIGFGARKIREDDPLGKYINSPETPIFNKSKVLYGLFHSKEAVREQDKAILVEGYADLISSYQAGVKNIVASSGTALTQEQIQLIKRYTKNITIVYDADSAGSQATLRGVDLILNKIWMFRL
jgi:DNA primase